MDTIQLFMSVLFVVAGMIERTSSATYSYNFDLKWAPWRLRAPYVVLMNDLWIPTWKTRNAFDKHKTEYSLTLPKEVPFAIACGACYPATSAESNLTLSVSGHDYESVPVKARSNSNDYTFNHGGYHCRMTYLITAPLKQNGQITCVLNRGAKPSRTVETIDFTVVNAVTQDPEELLTKVDEKEVTLQCPKPETDPKNTVNVWHSNPLYTDDIVTKNIPSLKSIINLRLDKRITHVTCTSYDIKNPTKVYRTRYKIVSGSFDPVMYHSSHSLQNLEHEPEEDAEFLYPKHHSESSLTSTTLILLLTIIVIVVLIAGFTAYRLFMVTRQNTRPPTIRQP
ncbi:unnamed protein product [Meganyctiphanes norvegica]|uniref:Uncharacterized protein n=1 Tax=Meganyctiphanes norvegica TaxID=48144 RepID=A0AAV2SC03_MEGNR